MCRITCIPTTPGLIARSIVVYSRIVNTTKAQYDRRLTPRRSPDENVSRLLMSLTHGPRSRPGNLCLNRHGNGMKSYKYYKLT